MPQARPVLGKCNAKEAMNVVLRISPASLKVYCLGKDELWSTQMALDERKGVWKSGKGKGRHTPKGRQLDDVALEEVRGLIGDRPRDRDLLIEYLHLIQDEFGHLSAAHLRALAEEMRTGQAEVFEVASFYAHFDVVREGETPPPALTIRVCDSLACELAGAKHRL